MTRTWRARDARWRDNPLSRAVAEALTTPCQCGHGRLAHEVGGLSCDDCGCGEYVGAPATAEGGEA
jgi:hypothetical protein